LSERGSGEHGIGRLEEFAAAWLLQALRAC
jgi:hypothetical protein